MSSASLRSRVDRSSATVGLAAGDVLVIVGLIAVGELHHGVDPLSAPLAVADTVVPFLFGWAVAAPLLGGYGPRARRSVTDAVTVAALSWVGAAAIGLALRATPYFQGASPPIFAAVIVGTGIASLAVWRGAVAYLG